MNLKTLAKANVLQEKIEALQRALDAINGENSRLEIWVNCDLRGEVDINDAIPEDMKTAIKQAAKSAIEIELSRYLSQFAQL